MKITVLIENNSRTKNLACEHGLSFYIEYLGKQYLFDSGQSLAMLENANKLGISLENLDAIFISHGHYDHTGALAAVIEKNPNTNVYVGKGFFERKGKLQDNNFIYLGVSEELQIIKKKSKSFKEVLKSITIEDGIKIFTDFLFEKKASFVVNKNNELQIDFFKDEIAVLFETDKGSVLINGCAHNGILNIIKTVNEDSKKIHALFGGFHTRAFSDNQLKNLAQKLLKKEIEHIGISHCTGNRFLEVIDDPTFFSFNTGDVFITKKMGTEEQIDI